LSEHLLAVALVQIYTVRPEPDPLLPVANGRFQDR
jgi:hypothetical protein